MNLVDLSLDLIIEPHWNANRMDPAMLDRLRHSIRRFQLVAPLVVRPIDAPIGDLYETIGGGQRLRVLRELGVDSVPCVVVEADDAEARLLSQALNRIQGEDDPGRRAELLQQVLQGRPQDEVLKLLPETVQTLEALATLGQQDLAQYLFSYQQAKNARLHHRTFQFSHQQLPVVEEVLTQAMTQAQSSDSENPNVRGNALARICQIYLEITRRKS